MLTLNYSAYIIFLDFSFGESGVQCLSWISHLYSFSG